MKLDTLSAISPIDGRYRSKIEALDGYFSEYALIKYRVHVEASYFIALYRLPLPQLQDVDKEIIDRLSKISEEFSVEDAQEIKNIEKEINHDVKAVEYFLKSKFDKWGAGKFKEFIHFGLTSQDINNTAIPLSVKECLYDVYYPSLEEVINSLTELSEQWAKVPMLAKTHGQPASPTLVGKELKVFIERLEQQRKLLQLIPISAKFGGATGNFNAHQIAYTEIDWPTFANEFINDQLQLERLQYTTQIEHYDNLAAIFDGQKRINTILIDLCRDIWTYISVGYFTQKIDKKEVGSSTMPHKVNPIDFENAEGNLGVANALFNHLSSKLPISRLQRDLTDSTVTRNIGTPFAHSLLSFTSILKGLGKLVLNEKKLKTDLEDNWSVVAEAIQTILRREGYPEPYEKLKELTRNNGSLDKEAISKFVETLDISDAVKKEIKQITPENYTGIF